MLFKEFLSRRKSSYDAKGDFARLATSDINFPDASSTRELEAYVEQHHGSNHSLMDAGKELWTEFQKEAKRALPEKDNSN